MYDTPRPVQSEFLTEIENDWGNYDVFVGIAPTASGKEALALTIANWSNSARYIVPNNVLVDQIQKNHPSTIGVKGVRTYSCTENNRKSTCSQDLRTRCRGCPYNRDNAQFNRGRVGLTNYHMYAMKLQQDKRSRGRTGARDVLIVDEAHNVLPFLQEQHSAYTWKHKFHYPDSWTDADSMKKWIEDMEMAKAPAHLVEYYYSLRNGQPRFILEEVRRPWKGGGVVEGLRVKRGDEVEAPALKFTPIDIRNYPDTLWPRGQVEKIILLSATISRKDIEDLGLDRKRVKYLECKSPIPYGRRPIYISDNGVPVVHSKLKSRSEEVAHAILELADTHKSQKGFVHTTYTQAKYLRTVLGGDDRFIFHSEWDKTAKFEQFKSSSPTKGSVLVASGMYEGVSLDYDVARWQCIAKVPWLSLDDGAVKWKSEQDPEWYTWQTLKHLIQACGRVCRTPSDYGKTYILDSTFEKLLTASEEYDLIPAWFAEALLVPINKQGD